MPPTTWDVDVYLADSTVEEREAQSANDSMVTSNVKAALASLQGKCYTPKTYKPHQPRFEVKKEFMTSASNSDLVVLSPFLYNRMYLSSFRLW
jgi:hypothetical protein